MPPFSLTQKALDDLKDIARYTEKEWGREQRNIYLAMLDACFHGISADPEKGRSCGDIRKGYRKLAAGRHIIFYRAMPKKVVIVRVLHQRMDVETKL